MWPFGDTRRQLEEQRAIQARTIARIEQLETVPRPAPDVQAIHGRLEAMETALATLSDQLEGLASYQKDLTLAVDEGIERTERAERRIKAVVKRARQKLADNGVQDPALEAEADNLPEGNGEGGYGGGVPPMRRQVEPAAPEASSIRGVPASILKRHWGL